MLRDKRILVISPQPWGEIHVSKHHYALELAKRDNHVIFLNPMKLGKTRFTVNNQPVQGIANLSVAQVTLPVPAFLRFKWRGLYDVLIDFFSARLALRLGGFDVVWCFDPNYFHNLKKIAPLAVYHPVDPIIASFQITCGRYADIILTVSEEIMKPFRDIKKPKYIINHGISGAFRDMALRNYQNIDTFFYQKPPVLKIGYVGNLLRKEIDWELIYTIIDNHPDVEFNFWGPSSLQSGNLAGDDSLTTKNKIEKLKTCTNVKLHGVVPSDRLSSVISPMDGFLLIYKHIRGQSDRSNSHKILEYFCTGKTLVSFRVKAYENHRDLIVMPEDDDDSAIVGLFRKVIANIETFNNKDHVQKRLAFALASTYENNLNKIEDLLINIPR